jgi:Flp pilus assembly protein TadB
MLTREEHLRFCEICTKRQVNFKKGMVCSLTGEHATFDPTCPDYDEDHHEIEKKEKKLAEDKLEKDTAGLSSYGIKNRIAAGIIIIVGAILWLVAGLVMNRLSIYALVILVVGLVVLVNGIRVEANKPKAREEILDDDIR